MWLKLRPFVSIISFLSCVSENVTVQITHWNYKNFTIQHKIYFMEVFIANGELQSPSTSSDKA